MQELIKRKLELTSVFGCGIEVFINVTALVKTQCITFVDLIKGFSRHVTLVKIVRAV